MKNDEVVVVSYKNDQASETIGVCSDEESAKKLIHKLECTVPRFFGASLHFSKRTWEVDKNLYEKDQLKKDKAIIINVGNKYNCLNAQLINIDYKKFLKSKKKIDQIKLVVNSDDLIHPIVGYLSDEIEYYETDVKPDYQDEIMGEKDGFIIWVDYNYNEKVMFDEAKKIKENFLKKNKL